MSVVIATRDRRELLERVLAQLLAQLGENDELIVVDDSTSAHGTVVPPHARVSVIRSGGCGPATARNLGWQLADGEVIAFTDDDVLVDQGWLAAIKTEFVVDAGLVAVEGRTVSRPFDHLYEYSVHSESAFNGLTCNVAYRRAALERLGGFDEDFHFAHCEDVDLFLRARRVGRVAFSEHMQVEHEPRPVIPAQFARRGGWLASEWRLYTKHRERRPYPLPPMLCALIVYLRWPIDHLVLGSGPTSLRNAARLRRAVMLTALWWWHVAGAVPSLLAHA